MSFDVSEPELRPLTGEAERASRPRQSVRSIVGIHVSEQLRQRYLREHQPPTLIVWGPRDGYMPEPSARAYLRDLPNADLHLFPDGGHWPLETHLAEVTPLIRAFLDRALS